MSLFYHLLGAGRYIPPLVLSIDDNTPSGTDSGAASSGSVTSNVATVSVVSGGSGSYTYAWAINDTPATNGPFNCIAPTSNATAWQETCDYLAADDIEIWTCTVTDTGNGKVATINATVTLVWVDIT